MEQHDGTEEGERDGEAAGAMVGAGENQETAAMSRKEKRKAMKKMKRKQIRKEVAEKDREEAEARVSDPAEQERLRAAEEEEAKRRERELKEFEERERAWLEAMELKRKKEEEEEDAQREEEERRRKDLEESRKLEASEENECGEDGEWEYVEEGPPEIIFQGNEIILRKKKVRVLKKLPNQVEGQEIADRPTSNPLPPETEAFADFQNASSAQRVLESVAHQVPNFGTEQDKAHCPFHLKTGACRFGQRCSRVHFYPDKSCTLLMKNMYSGPGIAWEQDEGLEYTDEEVERCYEEFYEDVHTEFLKYGELVNFKVCRNGSLHLRGNVYVHYRSLESAILAFQSINGRYFAGKQVQCEFINVPRWKVAICGEYMKSRLKTCSRGSACNFIHCFRNPGGDYEWADYDKPPPRYWIRKMAALFGYSAGEYVKQNEWEYSGTPKKSGSDLHRRPARRSRSRDGDHAHVGSTPSYRSHKSRGDTLESNRGCRPSRFEDCDNDESQSLSCDAEDQQYSKKTLHRESKWSEYSPGYRVTRKRIREKYSDDDSSDRDEDDLDYRRKSWRRYGRRGSEVQEERLNDEKEKRRHRSSAERSSRKCNGEGSSTNHEEIDTIQERSQGERAEYRRERNSSRSSPGERSEDDSVENRHHPHKRKGSNPRDDGSEGSNDEENNKRRRVVANNIGHRNEKLELPRDHRNNEQREHECGKRGCETDSDAKRSDRSRKGKTKRHCDHRSSGNGGNARESPEHNRDYKSKNRSASSDEKSDRETGRGRHSRQCHEIPSSLNNYPRDNKSETNPRKSSVTLVCEPEENMEAVERWRPDCSEDESG